MATKKKAGKAQPKGKKKPRRTAHYRPRIPIPDLEGADDPTSALSFREELFIEQLFLGKFDPQEAARRAGYDPKYVRQVAYQIMDRPRVAAAINAYRAQLRHAARLTREEWLQILERDIRDGTLDAVDRHRAGCIWARALGYDKPGIADPKDAQAATPQALRALPREELIAAFNRGAISQVKTRVIDIPSQRVDEKEKVG